MLRYTDPKEVLLRDKNGMRMKTTSDIGDKDTVDRMIKEIEKASTAIPPPNVVISAFETGIQVIKDRQPDGNYRFNFEPLLPINGKQATRTLFDKEKIKEYLAKDNFVQYPTAQLLLDVAISDDAEEYAVQHRTELSMTIDELMMKGSFLNEMKSYNSVRVMYSKVRTSAMMGYLKFISDNGLVDYLSAGAKDIFDNIDSKESAIKFYEMYGNFYVFEVSVGACCEVSETVELTHQMKKEHIKAAFIASLKQIVNLDTSVETKIKTGFTTTEEQLTMRSVGGDITLVGDFDAYGKSAYEKPDIISYRTAPLYRITNDQSKRKFLEEAHLELMGEYADSIPTYTNPNGFKKANYQVEYSWENTDWVPWNGEKLHITLKLNGKTLAKNTINGRVASEKWCQRVRVPGGSFGNDWSGSGRCTTTKPLGKSSIDYNSSDLNGLIN